MKLVIKSAGRAVLTLALVGVIAVIAVVSEIAIDNLVVTGRDLRHLIMHAFGNVAAMMTFLSIAGYMARRKWKAFPGHIQDWLFVHRWFAVTAGVMALVHSGAHFKAALPVATMVLMTGCLVSGLIGWYVYIKAMADLSREKQRLRETGLLPDEVEDRLAIAAAAARPLANWRAFHRPLSALLAVLLFVHGLSALYYGG